MTALDRMLADAVICNARMWGRDEPLPPETTPLLSRADVTENVKTRRDEVLKMINAGIYREEIARKLGISYDVARNDVAYLVDLGLVPEIPARSRVPAQRELEASARRKKIAELYSAGKSKREIMDLLGCSMTTVHKDVSLLAALGKVTRKTRPWTSGRSRPTAQGARKAHNAPRVTT